MTRKTILVVEDDGAIRRGIADTVTFGGYRAIEAADGQAGLDRALRAAYDLLLLDLMLPGPGGLEILRAVRDSRPTVPVIILTARKDEADRVRGLQAGADDYVVKPFSVRELTARIEAVLRRSPGRPTDVRKVALPEGRADLESREVRFACGDRAGLSERETDLLRYLARNPGPPVTRDELLMHVWGIDPGGAGTRTVDMHVARLREKLRDDSGDPRLLVTVRGKGYMFQPAETAG